MLGVVSLDARIILETLVVLDELGRDAIGQVGRHMARRARGLIRGLAELELAIQPVNIGWAKTAGPQIV